MATKPLVGKMNATRLIRTLCRIVDAIRQFLQRPTTADGGTVPNGKEQALSNEVPKTAVLSETAAPPAVEVPSEVASGQETAIKPEVVHPVAEPVSTPESTITPELDTALKAVTDSAEDSTEGSTEDSAEDPEDESEHPSPPPPQASPEKNNAPPKQPQARSGRRGKSRSVKSSSQERAAPETRPKIICRELRGLNQWCIFLDIQNLQSVDVSQGETKLSSGSHGEYQLPNFTEDVNWVSDDKDGIIKLFDDADPLIFKLRKNWQGVGHQVRHLSRGCYVVFAPREWSRKQSPPVEASTCADDKFMAHYFFCDGASEADGFDECPPFFEQTRFSLAGEEIADDSDQDDLFIGTAPELNDSDNWSGISWIRVGEEGGGKWSENFKPTEKNLATVLENREGWFYVRVYDEDVKMIDGFDFRRLVKLTGILIDGKAHSANDVIAPAAGGHKESRIQFTGEIQAKGDVAVDDNNVAMIAANADADQTQWSIIGDNGQAQVSIHLQRIWWRMNNTDDKGDDKADEWKDRAFRLSRDDFYVARNAEMTVRLPVSARPIWVGFGAFDPANGARQYQTKIDRAGNVAQTTFKLRDFSDHPEISKPSITGSALRLQCDEAECTLIRVLADPEPRQVAVIQSPLDTSHPPQQGVFRPNTKNKRFSYAEIDAVGLTPAEAKKRKIAVDHRRKTTRRANIETLQTRLGTSHAD